jgi:transcription-repair coupling factor (superfamily II helicase)
VATEDRFGPLPEPVEHLFEIQEAKLKLARIGADYLVFRAGRAVVGPLEFGSAELRELRLLLDTAVYSSAAREVSLRAERFERAVELVDAILGIRLSA